MSTHVAMSSSCLFLGSMPEVFRTASELGYDSVEVLVTHQRTTQLTHELLDAVQIYQIPISAIHAPTLFFTQQVWGRPWTKIQLAAKMVEEVGAEVVVVAAGDRRTEQEATVPAAHIEDHGSVAAEQFRPV